MMLILALLPFLIPVGAFIGLGIEMYNPLCAHACRRIMDGINLDCNTTAADMSSHDHMNMKRHSHASPVTPKCRSTSVPFLTTAAYCITKSCYPDYNPPRSKVESFWYAEMTGDPSVDPMWSWQEAYDHIVAAPNTTYDDEADMILNSTMLLNQDQWEMMKGTLQQFEWAETLNSRYGLTLLLAGAGIPILLKTIMYLPYVHRLADWVRPRYTYPALLPSRPRHVQPFYRLFTAPTLGQSTYLGIFIVMTIVFSAVEYSPSQPNMFFPSTRAEIVAYVGGRTGSLCMFLLPLTVLFAGRNNLLLWLTDWSHSTYLLLHRYMARLCLVEMVLHSILELIKVVESGTYAESVVLDYWIWGCVGTVAGVIAVIASQFRNYYYEIFLISHILLVVFVIAGTWYHLEYLYQRKWRYEILIYLSCALWFLDRIIRVIRVMKVGMKQAVITPVGDEVVRVDIPGIRWSMTPGQHAYLYLPGIKKWAPWENHPFSVIPTIQLRRPSHHVNSETSSSVQAETPDLEKSEKHLTPTTALSTGTDRSTAGITLFVKRRYGFTRALPPSIASPLIYTALLDGPYTNSSSRNVLSTDRLILSAGGIGITGVLPFAHAHSNVKLYWSVREPQAELARVLAPALAGVESSIKVGKRNDLLEALQDEVKAGWEHVGVVVCGPAGMCDEVRKWVVQLGRTWPTKWELDVEAFLW